eukprot:48077-Prymnesium_polylepis.1
MQEQRARLALLALLLLADSDAYAFRCPPRSLLPRRSSSSAAGRHALGSTAALPAIAPRAARALYEAAPPCGLVRARSKNFFGHILAAV